MHTLIISDLSPETEDALGRRAAFSGRSVEDEARFIVISEMMRQFHETDEQTALPQSSDMIGRAEGGGEPSRDT